MILLTGASGLVGGHLLVHLLKRKERVRALKRNSSQFDELKTICTFYHLDFEHVMSEVEWVVGDLLDPASLDKATAGVTVIYHCAAVVSFGTMSAETLRQTNIEGTRNLIEAAIRNKIDCFAFVSSIGAIGQSVHGETVDEETPWNIHNKSTIYSNSKYAAEQEVWKASTKGLPVVIVNPGIILGAGDDSKGSLQLISQVKKGISFYTRQKSGYVDVRDVCRALTTLVDRKQYNQRFILVSENLTSKQLFTIIARELGKRPPFIHVGKCGLTTVARIEKLLSRITGKPQLLTPEIIASALKQETYSSEKIKNTVGFDFIPIKECIRAVFNG